MPKEQDRDSGIFVGVVLLMADLLLSERQWEGKEKESPHRPLPAKDTWHLQTEAPPVVSLSGTHDHLQAEARFPTLGKGRATYIHNEDPLPIPLSTA